MTENQKLHVLWIPSWYPTSEDPLMGCFFSEQVLSLKEQGINVGVIYPEIRPLKTLKLSLMWNNRFQTSYNIENGIPTCRFHGWNLFPKFPLSSAKFWANRGLALCKQYIDKHGVPDIIHAQSALWGGYAASLISKAYGIPYMVTEHRDLFIERLDSSKEEQKLISSPVVREIFKDSTSIIGVSKNLSESLRKYQINSDQKLVVLPDSVDTDFFCPAAEKIPTRPFTYLTVAKLIPSKNIAMLIQGFYEIHKNDPDVKLNIGGYGPEEENLRNLVNRLGISSKVEFLGMLNRIETRNAYRNSHVFVLPTNHETFGVVLIEAMACGLPTISTRCGGPEDIICEATGRLITPRDHYALTNEMRYVKENYDKYDQVKIRAKAVEEFGSSNIARKQIKLYQEAL